MPDARTMVLPEKLVAGKRLKELYLLLTSGTGGMPITWAQFCEVAQTVLDELSIAAIIPYTSGPCHRGFVKAHPTGKCPDLAQTGCPYIQLPGCFFQNGAVLVREPRSRKEAGCFQPNEQT